MKKTLSIVEIIFGIVPILIVVSVFIVALNIDSKGGEYKFKIEQYDPYDIFRGRYLNLNIPTSKIYLPEIQGYRIKTDDGQNNSINEFDETMINLFGLSDNEIKELYNIFKEVDTRTKMSFGNEVKENFNELDNNEIFKLLIDARLEDKITESDARIAYRIYEDVIHSNTNFITLISKARDNYMQEKTILSSELEKIKENYINDGIYINLEKDEDGYAKYGDIVENSEKGDNVVKIEVDRVFERTRFLNSFRIKRENSKYYVDEKYASLYERYINEKLNQGCDVYIVAKVYAQKMTIKDLVVEGRSLNDIEVEEMEEYLQMSNE